MDPGDAQLFQAIASRKDIRKFFVVTGGSAHGREGCQIQALLTEKRARLVSDEFMLCDGDGNCFISWSEEKINLVSERLCMLDLFERRREPSKITLGALREEVTSGDVESCLWRIHEGLTEIEHFGVTLLGRHFYRTIEPVDRPNARKGDLYP
jgi:hypothetical protein